MARTAEETAAYHAAGWWDGRSLTDHVRRWSVQRRDAVAFATEGSITTWAEYERQSNGVAAQLIQHGLRPGDRVAALFPDGPEVHVAWLAIEKAGLIAVGIGPRAGDREIQHLLAQTGTRAILSGDALGDRRVAEILAGVDPAPHHIPMNPDADVDMDLIEDRRLGPDDVFLLNSTSGTTGLPKCVMHTQNRWAYFHQLAVEAADLGPDDVFCSALPAPFGFGLWTAHFTPAYLGAPTHLRSRFDADGFVELLAAGRVSVLAAVTTQLIMLLNSSRLDRADLSALRVVFTGGEAVPYAKAAEFEKRTGATVLQFYGSNETGAVSRTTLRDDRPHRLTTAGRIITEMHVQLVDPVTRQPVTGSSGQPACRGPATSEGYWNDPAGNDDLYTGDGLMLMGDLVSIDSDGYLTVIGRTSDIVIRGGKNISAAAVEAEVMTHPAVAMAGAVAVPDEVLGERVCVFVQLREGSALTLQDLAAHLEGRGVTREWFPEYLIVADELPRSSGGKLAKAELRTAAARYVRGDG